MVDTSASNTTEWSSRFAFLMAAVGSSVGLGNLWRFSAQAGENGGGAFVLIYIICIVLIGIPVLICEYLIGRAGAGASAVHSVSDLASKSKASRSWTSLAWLGTISAFLIVSFYGVVASWVIIYVGKFATDSFVGQSAEQIAAQFTNMRDDRTLVIVVTAAFLLVSGYFVSRGVNRGIELISKLLMPVFFILLAALSAYSLFIGFSNTAIMANGSTGTAAARAIEFMFQPDFSKVSTSVVVGALGQAFFSIGLGSATMITYGSYLSRDISIPKSALVVGLTDTGVALVAGLAIFPIVFAFNLNSAGGSGLFFETLPVALGTLPGGALMGTAFFCLATFAALTTAIALLEVVTAFVMDQTNLGRPKAIASIIAAAGLLALGSAFSTEFMDVLDVQITGAIMVPLCGLLTVLFVGWKMDRSLLDTQLGDLSPAMKSVLLSLVKVLAPISVAVVLVAQIVQAFF